MEITCWTKHYTPIKLLGEGNFSAVYSCTEKKTKTNFAAKIIKRKLNKDSQHGICLKNLKKETKILFRLQNHENVVKIHEALFDRRSYVIITELIDGHELLEYLLNKNCTSEGEIKIILRQVLSGLSYIHSNMIAHLDIKSENIVIEHKSDLKVKIIDFGLARDLRENGVVRNVTTGTPHYLAPEVINNEIISTGTDMWSFGVVVHVLLTGEFPFDGETPTEIFEQTNKIVRSFVEESENLSLSGAAADFLSHLLITAPELRFDATACLCHDWLTENLNGERENSVTCLLKLRSSGVRKFWRKIIKIIIKCNRLREIRQVLRQNTITTNQNTIEVGLFDSLYCRSLKSLQFFFTETKISPTSANSKGYNPLLLATELEFLGGVDFLLHRNIPLNSVTDSGDNILHIACRTGNYELYKFIFSSVFDDPDSAKNLNIVNKFSETILHSSVRGGSINIVSALCGHNVNIINIRNKWGETALHLAVKLGYPEIFTTLVNHGSNVQLETLEGETILHTLSSGTNKHCREEIFRCDNLPLDTKDRKSSTALTLACRHRDTPTALLLIKRGSDVNILDSIGHTPLHEAAQNGLPEVVEAVAPLSTTDAKSMNGNTPLHLATREGNIEICRKLILYGSDPAIKNAMGKTPLDYAEAREFREIIDLLHRISNYRSRLMFTEQLLPARKRHPWVKLKVFGFKGVGKSFLMDLMAYKSRPNMLQRLMTVQHERKNFEEIRRRIQSLGQIGAIPFEEPSRAISISNRDLREPFRYNIWEFSGDRAFFPIYDRFIGNTQCLYLVVVDVSEGTLKVFQSADFWLTFILSRSHLSDIGFSGLTKTRISVVIVGIAPDKAASPNAKSVIRELQTKFWSTCDIYPYLFIVEMSTCKENDATLQSIKGALKSQTYRIIEKLEDTKAIFKLICSQLEDLRGTLSYPVLTWAKFQDLIYQLNPLCLQEHIGEIVEYLQLIGEILFLGSTAESYLVVIDINWFTSVFLTRVLKVEEGKLDQTKPLTNGTYKTEDLDVLCPPINSKQLIALMESFNIGIKVEKHYYEILGLNRVDSISPFMPTTPSFPKSGIMLAAYLSDSDFEEMAFSLELAFPSIKMSAHKTLLTLFDCDQITSWRFGLRILTNKFEAFVILRSDKEIEISVRSQEFILDFLDNLVTFVSQTILSYYPNLSIVQHLMSSPELTNGEEPQIYSNIDIVPSLLQSGCDDWLEALGNAESMEERILWGPDCPLKCLNLMLMKNISRCFDSVENNFRGLQTLARQFGLEDELWELLSSLSPMYIDSPSLLLFERILNEFDVCFRDIAGLVSEFGDERCAVCFVKSLPIFKIK